MRDLVHHQPEAQHPKSSAIHKPPADYPIFVPRGWPGKEPTVISASQNVSCSIVWSPGVGRDVLGRPAILASNTGFATFAS